MQVVDAANACYLNASNHVDVASVFRYFISSLLFCSVYLQIEHFFYVELTNSFVLFSGTYYILIHELQGLIGLYVKGKCFVTIPKLQNIKTKNY